MRQEEMYFLGMQRRPKTAKELERDNPIAEMMKEREHRKHIQENNLIEFDNAKQDLED